MVCIFPSSLCMSIPKDKINPVAWLYSGLPDFPDFRKIYMASPRCAAEEKSSNMPPSPSQRAFHHCIHHTDHSIAYSNELLNSVIVHIQLDVIPISQKLAPANRNTRRCAQFRWSRGSRSNKWENIHIHWCFGGNRSFNIGENGVTWPVGLLGQPHISHSWQSGKNFDYHGSIHRHEHFLEKKYRHTVPFSILKLKQNVFSYLKT